MTRNPQTQSSNRDMTVCVFCGADDSTARLVPHDVRLPLIYGRAWQLSAMCSDSRACAERRTARDRHMDERYELTAAGRQALAVAESVEVA
jgi:hypothetical protein